MLCASNINFTIVIPFLVAVRIKGPTLSFPRHTILASFTDTLVSPGSGCNQRESMVMISVMDSGDFTPSAARSMRGWQLPRSRPPSAPVIPRGAACIIPTVGRNTLQKPIALSCESTDS